MIEGTIDQCQFGNHFYEKFVKRGFDVVSSILALPIVGVLSLPIAIAIKLEDGGNVFYLSERYGKDMKKFPMYKFRSMRMNAEDIRNADGTTFNSENDDRQTKVGKILRRSSLDELPQLLNVLVGDMSLVGPRPSPMGNEATYTPYIKRKFTVRPGITGLNQALKRNSSTLEERYNNDVYYAEHVSLGLDLKILAMTVSSVLKRENIYQQHDDVSAEAFDLRKHQLKAVEAIKVVDAICANHGIEYFLIAGSALGAVRHKGFIPWDDDIDIVMTQKNMELFLNIAPIEITAPYVWKHTTVDNQYPTLSGGVFFGENEPLITVFPLVKLSDNVFERRFQWVVRKVMSPIWQRKVGYQVPADKMNMKQIVAILGSTILSVFFSRNQVLNILRNNEAKYENREVQSYCNIYSRYSLERESIRTEWIQDGVIRVPYEDTLLPILKDYDLYLTHLYGDYMTPPPASDRKPIHLRNEGSHK